MRNHVIVSFGPGREYTFDLDEVQPMPHELARQWLDEQFTALGCEPLRLTGKVLTADKVLAIAQAVGEERFAQPEHRAWAMVYARAASSLLAKPIVKVDVPALTVGY
ncbi:MAG: hypothetical protein N2256_03290 [Tepidimonas ignava]|uniref:Uncharacterized protein n=1 Tax=Tepidimonas ignava TaxID=114249 RepID=A0A4V2UVX7_9BURK|nr:hypothetical protein [Tepidimonas ignava]MCX7814499.1 hypothetical protein [Tepidimonas ignava]TCS97457.1 hypothetical protein EDC36_10958 [Tepidimonas ignava]TSE22150.1 hypothetical protein Tigna_01318 [Tepidimonas ignava]